MHDPKCLPDTLCVECEVYDVGMEASKPAINEAFHAHLHEVIAKARATADANPPRKAPVQIKPLPYIVAYREGYAYQGSYEYSEFETLEEAYEFAGHHRDYRIFIATDLVMRERRVLDYPKDFAYVGEEIRKEQSRQQTDYEG